MSSTLSFLTWAPDGSNRSVSRLSPFTLGEWATEPNGQEAVLAPEPVWTLLKVHKYLLALPRIELRFLVGRPARNLVTMPTGLSRQRNNMKCDS
jgi:hypothetical protein